MKRKTFSKGIWILIIISFIQGIDFTGMILDPFFTEWGGLDKFNEVQKLQSIFTFSIFIFEVPTGLIGDTKGLKYSLIAGEVICILGYFIYGSIPNFYIFALGEVVLAISSAFISGARESMFYETAKDNQETDVFNKIVSVKGNFHLAAMLLTSLFGQILIHSLELNHIFLLNVIPRVISLILMIYFVKEPKVDKKRELVPDYRKILRDAIEGLKNDRSMRRTAAFMSVVAGGSYFVLWFHQALLKNLGVQTEEFPRYRIFLILSEIFFASVIIWLSDKYKKKRMLINIILVLLVATGFFIVAFWKDTTGVILFLIVSGGIGLKSRDIFSKTLNDGIDSKQRATSLSAISMILQICLAVLNIIFGYLADINLYMTLGILGGILLIGGLVFLPKDS